MRVTESQLMNISSDAIVKARERSADATTQMSSGLRVALPSDDVAAWSENARISARAAESSARGTAIATATDNLQQTDGALAAIGSALDSARELATEAANGTMSAGDRAGAAVSINTLRDTVVGQANVKNTAGDYLLAGSQGGLVPFDSLGNYAGDAKQLSINVSETQSATVSVSGTVIDSSTGVNVVSVLDNLSSALASNDQSGIETGLTDLQTAIAQVAHGRQLVGQSVSSLQNVDDARTAFEQQLATRSTALVDVDAVVGATQLAQAKNDLDTATAVAAQVVSMVTPSR